MRAIDLTRGSSIVRTGVVLLFAGALASCMTVAESIVIYETPTANGAPGSSCHTRLGSYSLPKSYLHFHIDMVTSTSSTGAPKKDYVLTDVRTDVKADTRRTYCLDYLASAFADDLVTVTRSSEVTGDSQQLLRSVSSSSVDQTAIIIRTLIRAVFTALSATLRGSTTGDNTTAEAVADFTFDPFNQAQSAVINERIRRFGFCFVLESFTFGPQTRETVQSYCRNPIGTTARPTEFATRYADYEATDIPPETPGIFYRPRANYELSIFAKDDPGGPGPWLPRRTMPVSLENISPVIAVKVDRAAFTEKQIGMAFVQGDLAQVCIYKKSELVQFALIPLEVVKSIVALPTQMLQIQYDQITQSTALVAAENKVLQSQNKLLALMQNPNSANDPGAPAGAPALPTATPSPVTPTSGIQQLTRTGTGADFASCNGISPSASPPRPTTAKPS
jgi:hypothetical protein